MHSKAKNDSPTDKRRKPHPQKHDSVWLRSAAAKWPQSSTADHVAYDPYLTATRGPTIRSAMPIAVLPARHTRN